LWYALLGKQLNHLEQQKTPEDTVIPTENDIEILVTQFRRDRNLCALYLTHVLNRIVSQSKSVNQLNENEESLQFVPEDITQLLLDAPFYRFELQYPAALKAETIWDIYCHGALLTLTDIGAFIWKIQ
jgi:hypothetical protein